MKTKYIVEKLTADGWKRDQEFFDLTFAESFLRLLRHMGFKAIIKVERVK